MKFVHSISNQNFRTKNHHEIAPSILKIEKIYRIILLFSNIVAASSELDSFHVKELFLISHFLFEHLLNKSHSKNVVSLWRVFTEFCGIFRVWHIWHIPFHFSHFYLHSSSILHYMLEEYYFFLMLFFPR